MKKIILLVYLLLSIGVVAQDTDMLEFRFGGNVKTNYNFSINDGGNNSNLKPKDFGYEGVVELIHSPIDNLITGLGTGYQRNENIELKGSNNTQNTVDTVPVYATVKYLFNEDGDYRPYLKLNLGVAIPHTRGSLKKRGVEAHTSWYYAVGGGIEYNSLILDLSYQYSQTKLKGAYDGKIKFSRVTLGIGYRLGI